MVSVCTGLLGEEGRVSTLVDTRLFINRIPLPLYMQFECLRSITVCRGSVSNTMLMHVYSYFLFSIFLSNSHYTLLLG